MNKTVNSRHRLLAAILSIEGQLHTAAAYTDLLPTVLPNTLPFLLHRAGTLQAWDSLSLCSYYADLLKSKKTKLQYYIRKVSVYSISPLSGKAITAGAIFTTTSR